MASMSKRAQARTEKELHDLTRTPGNSQCADCGARSLGWASWNLGVFLCERCASIHRKLGTHISKVKSLHMDTWTTEQLESMKANGNLAVNKIYNPKNKKPDIPLDADEVDGAMERFIRKKYQEKSLSDGKPEVPSRDTAIAPTRTRSPEVSPPPMLPPKKNRFFGFGLRASSSAYPLSKHDKKHRNEPRVDSAFRIASDDYSSMARTSGSRGEISDHDMQIKLAQLRDMGFTDNERNMNLLKRQNGDVERTIAALVKLGPSEQSATRRSTTPTPTVSTAPAALPQTTVSAPQSAVLSNNPFDQIANSTTSGLSYNNTTQQPTTINTNPWQSAVISQPPTGLEQSFSTLQVSQPLFPHSTGGYNNQPQYASQPQVATLSNMTQSYPMTGSPITTNNPFMQSPMSAHSTGSNPYAAHMQQNMPSFAPSTNPFFNMPSNSYAQQMTSSPTQSSNPFGLPPSNSPPQTRSQSAAPQLQQNAYGAQSYGGSQFASYDGTSFGAQQQFAPPQPPQQPQSPPALPNFQYGQPQPQPQQIQQQSVTNSQPSFNSYQQQPQQIPTQSPQLTQTQFNQQPQVQQPQQQPQQPQTMQSLMPQKTGRYDKNAILALYNYPQLAPAKPLASIPEPSNDADPVSQSSAQQQFTSPAPTNTIYGGASGINPGKRSATMPASSMHSAGGTGSRNPFMTSATASGASTPSMSGQQLNGYSQGARHASHDSMAVNNPVLQDGRHSPDAFASLSARYLR